MIVLICSISNAREFYVAIAFTKKEYAINIVCQCPHLY